MSRLPDEFRRPEPPQPPAPGGPGEVAPASANPPVGEAERTCDPPRDLPRKHDAEKPAGPRPAGMMARFLAEETRQGAGRLRRLAWIRERPPSVEDRYARVRRVGADLGGTVPLLRGCYLAGEYVAATVATVIQLTASAVGTLAGLLTTAAVILTVLLVFVL